MSKNTAYANYKTGFTKQGKDTLSRTINLDAASFSGRIDKILKIICEKIQLSQTQHIQAEEHYMAVSRWLEQEDSILSAYKPKIYPQGSLPMGVTNKPLKREEYDLDFICELQLYSWQVTPADLFSKVEYRISQHKDYRNRMELGKRCIKLTYAHDFHLDIVPACTNGAAGYGQVQIPDRELESWRDTNSKQYVEWFNAIADQSQEAGRIDAAEPLSPPEAFEEKSALKFAVQLMKRYRDIAFQEKSELAPVSIVLSTLSAQGYSGSESVFETVKRTLETIQALIESSPGRLQVWNPANCVLEDLGERWDSNPDAYAEFKSWISEFGGIWQQLEQTRGTEEISRILISLFGEYPTQEAIREDARRTDDARQAKHLGVTAGTATLTIQSPAIIVPKNTFYGQ